MISVHRAGLSARAVPLSSARVGRIVQSVLRAEKKRTSRDISVIFVDRRTIRRLNRRFLNEHGSTDVIAFPYDDSLPAPDAPLGDIYICVPEAAGNARRFKESFEREMVRLVIHGTLHLLGYKDEKKPQHSRMWKRQEALMSKLAKP